MMIIPAKTIFLLAELALPDRPQFKILNQGLRAAATGLSGSVEMSETRSTSWSPRQYFWRSPSQNCANRVHGQARSFSAAHRRRSATGFDEGQVRDAP